MSEPSHAAGEGGERAGGRSDRWVVDDGKCGRKCYSKGTKDRSLSLKRCPVGQD